MVKYFAMSDSYYSMVDGQMGEDLVIGNKEDIRTLVEWQQQRYHQLQNISLALMSGFLTILAIIATILSPRYSSFLIPLPSPETIRQLSGEYIFGYAGMSAIIAFNYLIAIFMFALCAIFAFFGVYKLYNIVSNPPLEPKLVELALFEKGGIDADLFEDCGFSTVESNLRESFYKNKTIIEGSRRDFRMALIRLPTALIGGHFATQLYFHTTSLNLPNILFLDIILFLPASALTLNIGNVSSNLGNSGSTPSSIAQEISKKEGGRFPTELIGPEKWITVVNNVLEILILLTIILELGWKYTT